MVCNYLHCNRNCSTVWNIWDPFIAHITAVISLQSMVAIIHQPYYCKDLQYRNMFTNDLSDVYVCIHGLEDKCIATYYSQFKSTNATTLLLQL